MHHVPHGLSLTAPSTVFYAAVTRKAANGDVVNTNEAITVPQAVLGYTRDGAKIGGFDDNGTLEAGKAADFVILNKDIFTVPHNELQTVRVKETWMAGEKVFEN